MDTVVEERPAASVESLAAIVSHPLRRRIWYAITEQPISPRELADQLHEPVNDVAYHVRVLRDMGVIVLARTQPVRGVTQHFYRLLRRSHLSTQDVEAMALEDKVDDATNILQLEFADSAASLEAGKLVDRPEHYLFRMPVTLDEQGWQDFHDIFAAAADRLYAAEARCVDRRRARGEEGEAVSVVAHLNLFERG